MGDSSVRGYCVGLQPIGNRSILQHCIMNMVSFIGWRWSRYRYYSRSFSILLPRLAIGPLCIVLKGPLLRGSPRELKYSTQSSLL